MEMEKEPIIHEGFSFNRAPYPAVVITKKHLNQLRKAVYELYCDWILEEEIIEISHSWDPPWDSSGRPVRNKASKETLLEPYRTG